MTVNQSHKAKYTYKFKSFIVKHSTSLNIVDFVTENQFIYFLSERKKFAKRSQLTCSGIIKSMGSLVIARANTEI